MIHPRSYETCDKKAERKAKVEYIKRRRNMKDTAGDKLKLLVECENHLHFKTKT